MTDAAMVSAEAIDQMVDDGVDMTAFIREETLCMPNQDEEVRKVNCALPNWIVQEAEREARHLAISRSAVMNMWLAEKAQQRIAARKIA